MSSTVALPSQSLHNFSLPPSKYSAASTNHFTAHNLSTTSQQNYSFFSSNGFIDKSNASGSTDSHLHQHHPVVEISETKPVISNDRPKIVIKFRTKINNNTNDGVIDVADQTLAIARKDEECGKVVTSETKSTASDSRHQLKIKIKLGKRSKKKTEDEILLSKDGNERKKRRTFSISLTKEEIEADRIAMGLGGLKRSTRIKKRSKSGQKILGNLFPGSRLKSISLDDYRV